MSKYKQCPNGHYYPDDFDYCPYCPIQFSTKERHQYRNDYTRSAKMTAVPMCKFCGRPLRGRIPHPPHGIVVSSLNDISDHIVPWNYQWDGKCEHCGHDYNLTMGLNMSSYGDNCAKRTTVKVSSRGYSHNLVHDLDCACDDFSPSTILSGVEIHTKTSDQDEKIFISANELRYIINALENSPVIQQFDYKEEYKN